jgi:sensor histidine kinase YesM
MAGNKTVFWSAQSTGWLFYLSLLLLYNYSDDNFSWQSFASAISICLVGFLISSLMRLFFVKLNWHRKPFKNLILRITLSSLAFAFLFHVIISTISFLVLDYSEIGFTANLEVQIQVILNWAMLLLFWSLLFFTSNYFLNYRTEQLRTAKLEAENKIFEVQQLKSQLNPHFLFNALNSIKALITEDPNQARNAINKLSNLLRRTLNTSGETLINIEEELDLVESYLALEKIRFEERLQYTISSETESKHKKIPPLMLQTLVENAVKHGIDKTLHGGEIKISIQEVDNQTVINIINPGTLGDKNNKGIGLENTRRRLRLMFTDKASLTLTNSPDGVSTTITLPHL